MPRVCSFLFHSLHLDWKPPCSPTSLCLPLTKNHWFSFHSTSRLYTHHLPNVGLVMPVLLGGMPSFPYKQLTSPFFMSHILYLIFFFKKCSVLPPGSMIFSSFKTLVICWFPLLFSPLFYNAFPIFPLTRRLPTWMALLPVSSLGVNKLRVQCLVIVTGSIIFLGLNYSTLGIGKKNLNKPNSPLDYGWSWYHIARRVKIIWIFNFMW